MRHLLNRLMIVWLSLTAIASASAQTTSSDGHSSAGAAIPHQSTRTEVVAILGEPTGTLSEGHHQILIYNGIEVKLEDDKVIEVVRIGADGIPRKDPIPQAPAASEQAAEGWEGEFSMGDGETVPSEDRLRSMLTQKADELSTLDKVVIGFGLLVILVGVIGSIAAGIWFLVRAFTVHLGWGFACLLLPMASLVFLIMHWKDGGKPFLASLGATAVCFVGMGLVFMGIS